MLSAPTPPARRGTAHRRRDRAFAMTASVLLVVAMSIGISTGLPMGAPAQAADVPDASPTTAVITVATGGQRSTPTETGPLAGVVLRLYGGSTTPDVNPLADVWATCTSDATGDCSFVVPDTQPGGANRDRRFWVRQAGAPAGWFANPSLVTGPSNDLRSTAYQFRTGDQLRAGNTYASSGPGATFMQSAGNTNRQASGGIWQSSRTNPGLPPQCGLDVALVLDVSGSVGRDLPKLKNAAKTFTNSLAGTPSQLALFTFASTAPANASNNRNRPLTPVSTPAGASQVNTWIDGLSSGGSTNWDRGFFQVAQDPGDFDVAIVITDGNPTYFGNQEGPGNFTRFHEVEDGVFSANAIKAEDTRVIAVGVGDGVSGAPDNLQAISGPTVNDDYYQTDNYDQAGAALKALALGNCSGSVTVVKQVVPSTAPAGSTDGAQPAGGWQFTASSPTDGVVITPQSGTTQEGTGALNFDLTFPGGTTSAAVSVAETPQPGYTPVQVSGKNAVCTRLDSGAVVPVDNVGATGFTVGAPDDTGVGCTVYNRAPDPRASVVVDKTWEVNGETFPNGQQPPFLVAGLLVDGAEQEWGQEITDLVAGSTVPIAETIDTSEGVSGLRLCTLDSARVTEANGQRVDQPAIDPPYEATLQAGANTYMITNTVTCRTQLTLNKVVGFGAADPASWTLTGTGPTGAAAGPNGPTGATAEVTPAVPYTLAESGGDPNYVQLAVPEASPVAGSSGSWICVEVDQNGIRVRGLLDGLDGSVTVPLGTAVSCFAVNATASLTMVKEVVNEHGGTAEPDAWDLTATPGDPNPAGAPSQTVDGSAAGVTVDVRPGQPYALGESAGPTGYLLDSITCTVENAERSVPDLTLAAGDTAVCTFRNVDQPATLTLVKEVDNGSTGAGAVATNWTLSANGPTPVSGASGESAITDAEVTPGSYTLAEADGPDGFERGTWACTGGTVAGAVVEVPVGGNVRCRITNTAIAPTLTLVKKVNNTSGGSAQPEDWILDADSGDVRVTGRTGTPAVSEVAVPVGTYELTESGGPAGYTAAGWSCEGASGSDTASVVLALGDEATCTVTNTDQPATLTLRKVVDPSASGSGRAPADWSVTATPDGISGQDPVSGNGDPDTAGGVQAVSVFAGSYDLRESGPAGFDAGQWICQGGVVDGSTVSISSGGTVVCTVINTARSPRLTLVKTVDNGDTGATAGPVDWTLTADGPTPISGVTADKAVTSAPVQVGTYSLAESGPPGYSAGDWSCEGGQQDGGSITLAEGQSAVCTINNSANQPTLTLRKTVDNGPTGATAAPTDWTLTADGPTPLSGVSGDTSVTRVPVVSGSYPLGEKDGPAGYVASGWSCVGAQPDGAAVTVAGAGVAVTCTITNTAVPPTLTLVKVVDNGATGATAVARDWTLVAGGPTVISGRTADPAVTGAVVQVGDYALAERDGVAGYQASDWVCDGARYATGTVSLAAGDKATCTVTNTAIAGSWLLDKSSDPPSGELVPAGSTITYRLTARHRDGVAVRGAGVTDDLSEVLRYGTLVEPLPDGLTRSGTELAWALPDIPVGESVQVAYQVTVLPEVRDVVLVNSAKPVSPNGSCGVCSVRHEVGDPAPPTPPGPTPPGPTPPGPIPPVPPGPAPNPLPNTGVQVGEYLAWAAGLVAAGALLLVVVRRRAQRQ